MEPCCKNIRDLREDSDLTQQEVADYLGTSQTMYARYERGANDLPIRHLLALCKLYRVSADYILGIKGGFGASPHIVRPHSQELTAENQRVLKRFEKFLLSEQKKTGK